MTKPVDTLIDARWVIPVEPRAQTLAEHSIAIADGTILDLLPSVEAHLRYAPRRHLKLDRHVVIPGLVNLHTHAAMTLMRGLADDLPLMDWLKNHIWPAELRFVSEQFVHDGTLLGAVEMLRGGVTCFNDMYFFPGAVARAALATRMRVCVGMIVIEFSSPYATDADDYLQRGLAVRDEYRSQRLISTALAPHAPYTISDKTFGKILTYAEQLDVPIHTHVHETVDEIEQSLTQYRVRPIQRLHDLGLLGPNLIAVHAVHLNAPELELLARQGCHVAHCPVSNLKLGSGIAPVAEMLRHGINVGIGSDVAASNKRLDLFLEMRVAALLAKGISYAADSLPAHQALRMATLDGARALGMDEVIGSLEPGKAADITALRVSDLDTAPCYDVASHLVYVLGREHVSHVWVNGELLVEDRALPGVDERELLAKAVYWRDRLRA
ncbi:MAG: TRZ/ATZ family hydrolase [Burkholderiales bacterium]